MASQQSQSEGETLDKDDVSRKSAQSGSQSGALEAKLEDLITKVSDIENRLRTVENRLNGVETSFAEEKRVVRGDLADLCTVMDKHGVDTWEFEEAVNVLPRVTRLGMKNLVTKLSNVLVNALALVTCIEVFQLASQCDLDDLWETSREWISENFVQVSQAAKNFWKLTLEEMCVFDYSDTLRANEEDVFQAITMWIEKDRVSRISSSTVLLRAVQFHHCSLKFLERTLDHSLVVGNSDLECAVKDAIKNWKDGKYYCSSATKRTERQNLLFALGGFRSKSVIETYSPSKIFWTNQENISDGPSKMTFAITAGHRILVLEEENKRFRSFNTLTKTWNDLRPLPVFRKYMSAAMEEKEIFVMGGDEHESRCDVYDIHLDSWTQVTSLRVGRWVSASSSLQGKIYCSGGGGSDNQFLSSMEMFDPKEKSKGWTLMTSMSVGRGGHCLVSCGQYLWAVGGNDFKNYIKDFERFEPSTNSWTTMAPIPTGRSALTASFFGGRLYVIGGWKNKRLNTVEVYDSDENRWTTGACLNKARHCHASCVVKEMSNAGEYQ